MFLYLLIYLFMGIGGEWGGGGGTTWVESCILAVGLTMHNWMT
jgi:hypothetical protein